MGDCARTRNQIQKASCCGAGDAGNRATCSCAPTNIETFKPAAWITGHVETTTGTIQQVSTQLTFQDILGAWKARWDIHRMDYKVSPGLYGVGHPDFGSPVLVSANYKMSFDQLRQELGGFDLWILVLDTKGVNVWCAAGKGTFGTAELVNRIALVKLGEVVSHRKLILPQLGAPGVAAHETLQLSGFKVVYGPVRAADIPEFLNQGMKVTAAMREVRFGFTDRLVLTPIELVGTLKPALIIFGVLLIMNLIFHGAQPAFQILGRILTEFLPFLGTALVGTVLVPALLPYLPGRALSWKGWFLGLLWAVTCLWLLPQKNWLQSAAYLLLLPSLASFLAMNFTGSTTYTSLSGVVREMKAALPAQIGSVGLGILLVIAKWVLWGI